MQHKRTNVKDMYITTEQMHQIFVNAENQLGMKHTCMMENAGHGIADFIIIKFKEKLKHNKNIIALCGTGFNGGDTFVASRHLVSNSHYSLNLTVVLLGNPH